MSRIDLDAFLRESQLELATLEDWCARGWLLPQGDGDAGALNEADAARAVFIRTLVIDMDVNDAGVDVVLDLVDQLHQLRRMVRAMQAGPSEP